MAMICGVVLPICTIVRTTDKIAIAKILSTTAAPRINLASFVCIFPIDDKTWIDIAILVAANAVGIKSVLSASNQIWKIQNNQQKMERYAYCIIVNELRPPFKNSRGVISNPATNNITIAANLPICRLSHQE